MSKYNLYVEDVSVEAVFNKLGGIEGARAFLRGETTIFKSQHAWREQNGVIYLSVTSDGTGGAEWVKRLWIKGVRLCDYSNELLRSESFKPTNGVIYEVAVLRGALFEGKDRVTKKIRVEAQRRGLTTPNAEVACLIREKLSDKELRVMDLRWIIAMHEPIKDSEGFPRLLGAGQRFGGGELDAFHDCPARWIRRLGFAFVVSETASEAQ